MVDMCNALFIGYCVLTGVIAGNIWFLNDMWHCKLYFGTETYCWIIHTLIGALTGVFTAELISFIHRLHKIKPKKKKKAILNDVRKVIVNV